MAETGSQDRKSGRFWRLGSRARTLKAFGILIFALVAASAFFALQVYRELAAAHEYHLRLLDHAAEDAVTRISLTLGNVQKLWDEIGDEGKVEEFARRQPYLEHRTTTLATGESGDSPICEDDTIVLDTSALPASIVACGSTARHGFDFDVHSLMERVLPREAFEGFLLFDATGSLLVQVHGDGSAPVLRTAVKLAENGAGAALGLGALPVSHTMSQSVRIADLELELTCQPLVVPARMEHDGRITERITWTLCGTVSRSKLLRQAITLSPGWTVAFGVLGLLGLALVPYVKPLFMARRERFTRTDLVLLATGTLLLLQTLTVVGFGTHRILALRSTNVGHLKALADRVEESLLSDLRGFHRALTSLDGARCTSGSTRAWADDEGLEDQVPREVRIFRQREEGDLPRLGSRLQRPGDSSSGDPLFLSLFWLDENGQQIHKITARDQNTAVVNVSHRGYFRGIRDRQGWPETLLGPTGSDSRIVVDTAFSITTSQPFFALSRRSECSTDEVLRVAVLTGVLPAMRPSISPAFGYAVIRPDGGVLVSSRDELQPDDDFFAVIEESRDLRSAIASGASQGLTTHLGRRPHRLHLRPSLPCPGSEACAEADRSGERWWIVTFYDREMTSTLFAEVLLLGLGLCVFYSLALGVLAYARRRHLRALIWSREDHFPTYFLLLVLLAGYLLACFFLRSHLLSVWSHLDHGLGLLGSLVTVLLPAIVPLLLLVLGFAAATVDPASSLAEKMKEGGIEHPGRRVYRVMLFFFWIAVAVVPAALYFEWAWELETMSLSRSEIRWWQKEEAGRERRIEAEWQDLADRPFVEARIASRSDRFPLLPFVPVCPEGDRVCPEDDRVCPEDDRSCPCARKNALQAGEPHVLEPVARLLPTYNLTSARIRHQWAGPVPKPAPLLARRDEETRPEHRQNGERATWILGLVLLGLTAVIWLWVRFVGRHCGLRYFERPESGSSLLALVEETSHAGTRDGGPVGRRIVILTSNQHWSEVRRLDSFGLLDLTSAEAPTTGQAAKESEESSEMTSRTSDEAVGTDATDPDVRYASGDDAPDELPPLAVVGLARVLADADLRASALDRLAPAVDSLRPILVFTGSDPWPILAEAAAGRQAGEGAGIADFGDARRWADLLSEFRTEYATIDWEAMGSGTERSRGDHWAIWWRCSDAEKLALLQLAQEGFLNPKQSAELEQLVRRNVLTFDEPQRPISYVDDEFCDFVQNAAASEHLLAWERQEADREGWHGLRYALGLFFVALFGFLFLVDPSLLDNLQTLFAGLAGIIGVSLGLLHRLRTQGTGGG